MFYAYLHLRGKIFGMLVFLLYTWPLKCCFEKYSALFVFINTLTVKYFLGDLADYVCMYPAVVSDPLLVLSTCRLFNYVYAIHNNYVT